MEQNKGNASNPSDPPKVWMFGRMVLSLGLIRFHAELIVVDLNSVWHGGIILTEA